MQYTENYSMNKPQFGENAIVTKLNENADTLDTLIYNTRQMQADSYDSTQTYNTGDLVSYNSALYRCLADNVTGTWDATKWAATNLAEEVMNAGGGESALADLEDVEITNPSTGQALLFDDDDDKWKNQDLPDVSVTKTASGNPIEITDGANAPLVKCVTAIQGNQDLHGYSKPWVGGAGFNKWDEEWESGSYVNGVKNQDSMKIRCKNPIPITPSTQYYFVAPSTANMQYLDAEQNYISNATGIPNATFTSPNNAYYIVFNMYNAYGTTYNNNIAINYPATVTTYSPYSNICPITAYNQSTISVGGKNILPMTLTIIKAKNTSGTWFGNTYSRNNMTYTVDVDSNGYVTGIRTAGTPNARTDLNLCENITIHARDIISGSTGGSGNTYGIGLKYLGAVQFNENHIITSTEASEQRYLYIRVESGTNANNLTFHPMIRRSTSSAGFEPYKAPPTDSTATFTNSIYQGNADFVGSKATATWGYIASYNGETLPGEWISSMDEYAPGTTPTTGAQVAYELASPTEETITPSNLPLKSLFGYNHIESSTGDMEVEYITENYQPLVDLIQSSKHVYSTQEQIVGTWIDGSTMYEKSFTLASQVNVSSEWVSIGYSVPNISMITSCEVIRVASRGTWPLQSSINTTTGDIRLSAYGMANIDLDAGSIVIIRYTKTTQTRSLSAPVTSQKAQIEPLTDKTEEVPTEEKAVNEEENTNER